MKPFQMAASQMAICVWDIKANVGRAHMILNVLNTRGWAANHETQCSRYIFLGLSTFSSQKTVSFLISSRLQGALEII